MKKLFTMLFGQFYFWYFVKFTYKDKKGNIIFNFTECIGLGDKKDVLNFRILKQASSVRDRMKFLPETLLKNGRLEADPICYLGWFKNPKK